MVAFRATILHRRAFGYWWISGVAVNVKAPDATLLIVEDEELVALDIERIVQAIGIAGSYVANTAEQALTFCASQRPDLVLLDISLAGHYEGVDLARQLQRRWQIPLMFISGHLGDDGLGNITDIHVMGYLVKPFHPVNLREAVAKAVADLPD